MRLFILTASAWWQFYIMVCSSVFSVGSLKSVTVGVFAVVVQSLNCVWLFVTPWTAACQAHYLLEFAQTIHSGNWQILQIRIWFSAKAERGSSLMNIIYMRAKCSLTVNHTPDLKTKLLGKEQTGAVSFIKPQLSCNHRVGYGYKFSKNWQKHSIKSITQFIITRKLCVTCFFISVNL